MMTPIAAFLMAALIDSSFSGVLYSQDLDRHDLSGEWLVLQHTVQEILSGGPLSSYSAKIAPGAHLVVADSLLDLAKEVAARRVDLRLPDESKPPVSIRQEMNPEGDAAFLLFGIQRIRKLYYHTVIVMKDSTGTWAIENWHVSP